MEILGLARVPITIETARPKSPVDIAVSSGRPFDNPLSLAGAAVLTGTGNPYANLPHAAERTEGDWQVYEYRNLDGEGSMSISTSWRLLG